MDKPFSAACERNRDPILQVLRERFADRRRVFEIGSGTGQHAVWFAAHLPHLQWQTSDRPQNHPGIIAWAQEAALPNLLPPLALDVSQANWPRQRYDAIFSANTSHIMAWPEVEAMLRGVGQLLEPGGLFCLYGPFNRNGTFTSASNAQFDASLKAQAPHMGLRDQADIDRLARAQGLTLEADIAMPSNNQMLIWRRQAPTPGSSVDQDGDPA